MLNEGNFQENLKSMINEPDNWSKEEYYSAFLDMTERFFNALISALEYENVILEKFGEEAGEAIIEKIALSNPSLMDMEDENEKLPDQKAVIMNLMDFANEQIARTTGCPSVDGVLDVCYSWISVEIGIMKPGFREYLNNVRV